MVMRAVGAFVLAAMVLGCQGSGEAKVASREERAAEISRLEEQLKSYDLLDSIVTDPKATPDPAKEAERKRITEAIERMKAQG